MGRSYLLQINLHTQLVLIKLSQPVLGGLFSWRRGKFVIFVVPIWPLGETCDNFMSAKMGWRWHATNCPLRVGVLSVSQTCRYWILRQIICVIGPLNLTV